MIKNSTSIVVMNNHNINKTGACSINRVNETQTNRNNIIHRMANEALQETAIVHRHLQIEEPCSTTATSNSQTTYPHKRATFNLTSTLPGLLFLKQASLTG